MNKKIVGTFVIIMLMCAFLTSAQNVSIESLKYESNEYEVTSFDEGNVPIWKVGNEWIYKVDEIEIEIEEPGLYIFVQGNIDDLSLKVNKVTEKFYELILNANILGSYKLNTSTDKGPVNITGNLKNTNIAGTITINKTDLGIKKVNVGLSGKLTVKIVDQPYMNVSFFPKIPIPATILLDIELGNPFPIIEFPLNTSKFWGIPATNFSLCGTVESFWLRLVNFINNIIRIPGIIEIISERIETDPELLREISDILKDILPVINIEYLLHEYVGIGNVFEIPEVPPLLCCLNKDNVTVPARPEAFEAFNISLMGSGFGNIYYSPEAGNIIKITGNFEDVLPFISNIKAELISYSYNP